MESKLMETTLDNALDEILSHDLKAVATSLGIGKNISRKQDLIDLLERIYTQ